MAGLLTGFDLAAITAQALPIVAIGLPIALAVTLGPKLALRAVKFIQRLV
jgi:hypothetical protein